MVRKRAEPFGAGETSQLQEVGGGTGRGGQHSTAARPQQVGGRGEGYQGGRGGRGGAQPSQAGGHRAQVDAGGHYQGQGRGVSHPRGGIASMQYPGSSVGSHGPGRGISQTRDGSSSAGYQGHGRGGSQPRGGMALPQYGRPHGANLGQGVPAHGMQFQQPGRAMLEGGGSSGGDYSSSGPSSASPELYQATLASQQPSVFLAGTSSLPASSTEASPGKLADQAQMLSLQSEGTSTQASKSMRFPPRPGMGTIGRKCLLKANHFLAELPDKEIYQYDVSVVPEVTSRGVNRAVMNNLVKLYKESHLGKRLPVYDGRKSLYTAGPLPFTSKVFSVTLVDEEAETSVHRRERQFTITIKEAGRADLHHLGLFLQGRQSDAPQHAVQALDIVLRELPTSKYYPVGRSFYSPDLGRRQSFGEGLESWRGFYQSIRPTQMGLSLNIGAKHPYSDAVSTVPIHIVTQASQLPPEFLNPSPETKLAIGFDCEGVDLCRYGTLCIMQLAFPNAVYLVDIPQGGEMLMKACQPALESSYITKVIHDCKRDSEALYFQFGIKLHNVVDNQIAYSLIEEQEGKTRSLDDYISYLEKEEVRVLLRQLTVRGALHCRWFCINDNDFADWPHIPTLPDNLLSEGYAPEEEILPVLHVPPGKMGCVIGKRGASILDDISSNKAAVTGSPVNVSSEELLNIFVKNLDGRSVCLLVTSCESIHEIKHKFQEKTGIPVNEQRLWFEGKELKYHDSVDRDCTLQLLVRLKGGMQPSHVVRRCKRLRDESRNSERLSRRRRVRVQREVRQVNNLLRTPIVEEPVGQEQNQAPHRILLFKQDSSFPRRERLDVTGLSFDDLKCWAETEISSAVSVHCVFKEGGYEELMSASLWDKLWENEEAYPSYLMVIFRPC